MQVVMFWWEDPDKPYAYEWIWMLTWQIESKEKVSIPTTKSHFLLIAVLPNCGSYSTLFSTKFNLIIDQHHHVEHAEYLINFLIYFWYRYLSMPLLHDNFTKNWHEAIIVIFSHPPFPVRFSFSKTVTKASSQQIHSVFV